MNSTAARFEQIFRERNPEKQEALIRQTLSTLPPRQLLDAAALQFDERGNEDRMRLAGQIAYLAGPSVFEDLMGYLETRPQDTVYFLGAATDPDVFADAERRRLLKFARDLQDPDLDEALEVYRLD